MTPIAITPATPEWEAALTLVSWLSSNEIPQKPLSRTFYELYQKIALEHRVIGRILDRLLAKGESGEAFPLYQELASQQCQIIGQQRQIEAAVLRLLSQMSEITKEFTIVKGLSIYYATQNPFLIYSSGDRDILIRYPSLALDLLHRPGIGDYKPPVQHEEVNILFEGCFYFDFHKHFPVWLRVGSYHSVQTNWNLGLEIKHQGNIIIKEIDYDDIRAHSLPQIISGEINIRYPRPAAAAFVQIVHFYRDLIRIFIPSLRRRPRVRLQELLDIRDLVSDRNFDVEYFKYLTEKYEARQQVHICASYIWAFFQDSVLLDVLAESPLFNYIDEPAELIADVWHGFTFSFTQSPAYLLFCPFVAPTIVSEIPSNTLQKYSPGEVYRLMLGDGQSIVHTHGNINNFSVELRIHEFVEIDASFSADAKTSAPLCSFVCIGLQYFHFNFGATEARHRYAISEGSELLQESHTVNNGIHHVKLCLSFDPHQQDNNEIRSLFCFGALRPNGYLDHGAMVSIRIPAFLDRDRATGAP